MKKTVISIILILPFLLIIIISFSARIVSNYRVIKVTDVCILDNEYECYEDTSSFIKLGLGNTYDLNIKIFPELASDKKVTFYSSNESVCEINEKGVITSLGYGSSKISVFTSDGRKSASIYVNVSDDYVQSVDLNIEELTLSVGQVFNLIANIYPTTALDKRVFWSSSDESVLTIGNNGKITALSPGVSTVSVITRDGNYTASAIITVSDEKDFGFIEYEENKHIYILNSNQINLFDLLQFDAHIIDVENIRFEILTGLEASIENNILTLPDAKTILIRAYVIGTIYESEIYLKFENK